MAQEEATPRDVFSEKQRGPALSRPAR